jgi:hypothetical protein
MEDAHNLYSQTALDFGLLGGVLLVVLLALAGLSALGLVRGRPPRTLSRLWAAGLLGGLAAHALYSLTDAVALGTVAGMPFCGSSSADHGRVCAAREPKWPTRRALGAAGAWAVDSGLLSACWPPRDRSIAPGNWPGYALLDPSADRPDAAESPKQLTSRECRAGWYEGLAPSDRGRHHDRRAAVLGRSARCSTELHRLHGRPGCRRRRAGAARGRGPARKRRGLLLAGGGRRPDRCADEAIALYRAGLALAPATAGAGWRWPNC